jgi:hypothetical protein
VISARDTPAMAPPESTAQSSFLGAAKKGRPILHLRHTTKA